MSQPDLARTLRATRPVAPSELRERVQLVAAQASPPKRHVVTWRRALVIAVPLAAAVAAGVIATRPSHAPEPTAAEQRQANAIDSLGAQSAAPALSAGFAPVPSAKRLQNITTSLELRVPDAAAISAASKKAVAISTALGGYLDNVNVDTSGNTGYAEIRLKIPNPHVQEAVRRLAALGTIVSEHVGVQDLQAGQNATTRLIARLQRNLAALRAQTQTIAVERRIAQITAHVQRLQRQEAATVRTAHYATVSLSLNTPQPAARHHGPLNALGQTFRWIGIGTVYALAVGTPFVLLGLLGYFGIRRLRQRREDALLSRS